MSPSPGTVRNDCSRKCFVLVNDSGNLKISAQLSYFVDKKSTQFLERTTSPHNGIKCISLLQRSRSVNSSDSSTGRMITSFLKIIRVYFVVSTVSNSAYHEGEVVARERRLGRLDPRHLVHLSSVTAESHGGPRQFCSEKLG